MDWDALQVFLAVARAGRVSAAARRLDVKHTTVARRLAALEAELGVPLFYRTASGYLLTPQGANVMSSAEGMEAAALAVTARAREKSAAMTGRVRIALPPEFASHWLVPRLAVFREWHPGIELQILVGTRQRNLWRGEAELALQDARPRQQGLVALRLARTSTALYLSRPLAAAWRLRIGAPGSNTVGPEALRGLSLLTYTTSFDMLQDAKWFHALRTGARVALTTNSTHALLAAARAGIGVAVLPRFVARQHDDLSAVSDVIIERDIWLVTHPEFRRDPKVRATTDFLKSIATGPDGLS